MYIINRQKNLLQNDCCELILKNFNGMFGDLFGKTNGKTARNQERDVDIVTK